MAAINYGYIENNSIKDEQHKPTCRPVQISFIPRWIQRFDSTHLHAGTDVLYNHSKIPSLLIMLIHEICFIITRVIIILYMAFVLIHVLPGKNIG